MDRIKKLLAEIPEVFERVQKGEAEAVAWYRSHEGEIKIVLEMAAVVPFLGPYARALEAFMVEIDKVLASVQPVAA